MFRNRLMSVFGVVIAIAMLATACAPATPATQAPATAAPATAAPATAAPATAVPASPTPAPTATPKTTRHGGWLDEIDYSIVDLSSVITQIGAGAVDLFSYGLAANKLADIKTANLCYTQSYGTFYDFMFNAAVFKDATVLNPFSDHKISRGDELGN